MDESTGFPVLNIRDIIASKRAAKRARDLIEVLCWRHFAKSTKSARSRRPIAKTLVASPQLS